MGLMREMLNKLPSSRSTTTVKMDGQRHTVKLSGRLRDGKNDSVIALVLAQEKELLSISDKVKMVNENGELVSSQKDEVKPGELAPMLRALGTRGLSVPPADEQEPLPAATLMQFIIDKDGLLSRVAPDDVVAERLADACPSISVKLDAKTGLYKLAKGKDATQSKDVSSLFVKPSNGQVA